MSKIIISLLLIASLAGILTSASLNALPGNALYLFKIDVTEKIGTLLAFTNNQKAESSEDIAENRLGELQALFQNNTLTSTLEVQLINVFDIDTSLVIKNIQTLVAQDDTADALQVTQNFETHIATVVATLPSDSAITSHLEATLTSLSALSGSISTTVKK